MELPSKFFYSTTSMMLILFFQPLLLVSLMEVLQTDFSNNYSILSYTFSIFMIIMCVFIFLSVWIINMKNFKQFKHPVVKKMFQSYIDPVRKTKFICFLVFPMYITKLLISCVFYVIVNNGYVHTSVSVTLSLLMIVYLGLARPFANWITWALAILLEVMQVLYFACQYVHAAYPTDVRVKKPFTIIQMVIMAVAATIVLVGAMVLSVLAILGWML